MSVFHIPEDFKVAKDLHSKVCVYDYHVSQSSIHHKIILNKNVFSFLLEGSKELHHLRQHTSITESSFLLIKNGQCLMSESLSPTSSYRSILFFFDTELLQHILSKNKIEIPLQKENISVQVFKYDAYIRNFVNSLLQLNRQKNTSSAGLWELKLEEILLYLIQRDGTDFLQFFLENNYLKQFDDVVENHVYERLNIEELAFLCHMSVSTFKRTFQRKYAQSPQKWFQDKRLEQAAYWIKYENKRPSDVYLQSGYDTLSAFIQAYKKKFGLTPKKHQI